MFQKHKHSILIDTTILFFSIFISLFVGATFFLHSVSFDIINKMNGTVFYFDAMSISFSVLVFFNADHCHRSSYLLFESF